MCVHYAIVRALGVMNAVINRVYQYPPSSAHLRDNTFAPVSHQDWNEWAVNLSIGDEYQRGDRSFLWYIPDRIHPSRCNFSYTCCDAVLPF